MHVLHGDDQEGKDVDDFEADKIRFGEAFMRDRSSYRLATSLECWVLAIIAIILYDCVSGGHWPNASGWVSRSAIAITGFVIGFELSPLVILAMSHGMPMLP